MTRPTLTATLALLLCVSTLHAQQQPAAKLPFTISKETTIITAPLRPDGTPDYVAALNGKIGKGVTTQSNGYILYLQAMGTGDKFINPAAKAETLKLLGAVEPSPAGGEEWVLYADYLRDRRLEEAVISAAIRKFRTLAASGDAPNAGAEPILADFIKARERQLSLIVEASKRPHWWVPYVAADGHLARTTIPPENRQQQEVIQVLCARAMMRATGGDFDGFQQDILAVKRLTRHMQATLPFNLSPGYSLDAIATSAIASVAAGGTLTVQQCETIRGALGALPPVASAAPTVDIHARWHALDIAQRIAMKDPATMAPFEPAGRAFDLDGSLLATFAPVDRDAVNWDVLLQSINKYFDDQIAADAKPTLDERDRARDQLRTSWVPLPPPGGRSGGGAAGGRIAGETREAYTDRIAHRILFGLQQSPDNDQSWRDHVMREKMLDLLLAAAQFKATHGNWPKTLIDLVPAFINEIPVDIHSPKGNALVSYARDDKGIWIYSPATEKTVPGSVLVAPDGTPTTASTMTLKRSESGVGIRIEGQVRVEKNEGLP